MKREVCEEDGKVGEYLGIQGYGSGGMQSVAVSHIRRGRPYRNLRVESLQRVQDELLGDPKAYGLLCLSGECVAGGIPGCC